MSNSGPRAKFSPRDLIKCAFELARRMYRQYYKSHNPLLVCWRAVETGKRSFFLLTVINNHATVSTAKLVSPSTKMAKRKMDNRSFQDRWEADYLFTNMKGRAVCLVCGANVAVTKEYNTRRHNETKHYEKYNDLDVKQKLQKMQKIKRSPVSQQIMFTNQNVKLL